MTEFIQKYAGKRIVINVASMGGLPLTKTSDTLYTVRIVGTHPGNFTSTDVLIEFCDNKTTGHNGNNTYIKLADPASKDKLWWVVQKELEMAFQHVLPSSDDL